LQNDLIKTRSLLSIATSPTAIVDKVGYEFRENTGQAVIATVGIGFGIAAIVAMIRDGSRRARDIAREGSSQVGLWLFGVAASVGLYFGYPYLSKKLAELTSKQNADKTAKDKKEKEAMKKYQDDLTKLSTERTEVMKLFEGDVKTGSGASIVAAREALQKEIKHLQGAPAFTDKKLAEEMKKQIEKLTAELKRVNEYEAKLVKDAATKKAADAKGAGDKKEASVAPKISAELASARDAATKALKAFNDASTKFGEELLKNPLLVMNPPPEIAKLAEAARKAIQAEIKLMTGGVGAMPPEEQKRLNELTAALKEINAIIPEAPVKKLEADGKEKGGFETLESQLKKAETRTNAALTAFRNFQDKVKKAVAEASSDDFGKAFTAARKELNDAVTAELQVYGKISAGRPLTSEEEKRVKELQTLFEELNKFA
jgi:hypothetical protein